jgi:hypothetical protein
MAITVQWAHLADFGQLDASGKAIVVGIFDRIHARQFPATHPFFTTIIQYSGNPNDQASVVVRVITLRGRLIVTSEPVPIVIGPQAGAASVHHFLGTQFPEPGIHHVEIVLNGQTAHRLPLTLSHMPAEQPPQPPPQAAPGP